LKLIVFFSFHCHYNDQISLRYFDSIPSKVHPHVSALLFATLLLSNFLKSQHKQQHMISSKTTLICAPVHVSKKL